MSKILQVAEKEIEYSEFPANSNLTKYGEWFGFDGVAWCGMFVSWCYYVAGFPLEKIGFSKGFAGCQTAVAHYTKTGQITKNPTPGCITFFDWQGDGRYDHVGIFKRDLGNGKFECIEGNTSLTNQSNGGQVMLRVRNYSVAIFVNPKTLPLK